MRRSLPAATLVGVGLLLLADFVLINPLLAAISDALLELLVLLAAGAALAGAVALVLRHWTDLLERRGNPLGSLVLLAGFGLILLAGSYPGSTGSSSPPVRWLVAALLAPLVAALFSMLFFFLLSAMRRAATLRSRQTLVMLLGAAAVVVLLLPVGGLLGARMAAVAGWSLAVPIGGVFRGMLIGVGIVTAVHAARVLLSVDASHE